MNSLKIFFEKGRNVIRNIRLDLHFKKELQEVKKISKLEVKSLQPNESDEVKQFYKKYGFNKIDLRWHEYLSAVTGKYDKEYIPENLYHCVIEPIYTRGSSDLEDKAYMHRMLPGIRMVSNIIKNVRGVFLDEYDNIISMQSVIDIILSSNKDLIIKPSRNTGGGCV